MWAHFSCGDDRVELCLAVKRRPGGVSTNGGTIIFIAVGEARRTLRRPVPTPAPTKCIYYPLLLGECLAHTACDSRGAFAGN